MKLRYLSHWCGNRLPDALRQATVVAMPASLLLPKHSPFTAKPGVVAAFNVPTPPSDQGNATQTLPTKQHFLNM